MAEIGIVASIIQLAGAGLKLSVGLYSFAETVSSADKDIKHIAKEVSLTSAVLNQLGGSLRDDSQKDIASDNAIQTAGEVVRECSTIFSEINMALEKGVGKGIGRFSLGKLKWPFLQPKMDLLRSNLERLKSTLILMLHVLAYAARRKQHTYQSPHTDFDRHQIQSLIEANQRAVAQFERLSLTALPLQGRSSNDSTFSKDDLPMTTESSLLSLSSQKPLLAGHRAPFSDVEALAAKAGSDDRSAQPTPLRPNIRLMSSMTFTNLIHWLQTSGIVVDSAENARTMLTATDMLPVESPQLHLQKNRSTAEPLVETAGRYARERTSIKYAADLTEEQWVEEVESSKVKTPSDEYSQVQHLQEQGPIDKPVRHRQQQQSSAIPPGWRSHTHINRQDQTGEDAEMQYHRNTALEDYQRQLMLLEQQRRATDTQEGGRKAPSHRPPFPVNAENTPSSNTSHSNTTRKRYFTEVAEPVARLDAERPRINHAHSFPTPPADAPNLRIEGLSRSSQNPDRQKRSNDLQRVTQQMQAPRGSLSSNMHRTEQQQQLAQMQQNSSQAQAMAGQPLARMQMSNVQAKVQHMGQNTHQTMPMLHHITARKRSRGDAYGDLQELQNPHSPLPESLPVITSSSNSDHAEAPVPHLLDLPNIGHGPGELYGGIMASGPSSYPSPLTTTPAVQNSHQSAIKGSTSVAATLSDEDEALPTPTPATPTISPHPNSFKSKRKRKAIAQSVKVPIAPAATPAQEISSAQPDINRLPPTGIANGDAQYMNNDSFDNPDVLDNFDFDSFLHNGEDGYTDFDPAGFSFGGNMEEKSNRPRQHPSADSTGSGKRPTTPALRASPHYFCDPGLNPPFGSGQGSSSPHGGFNRRSGQPMNWPKSYQSSSYSASPHTEGAIRVSESRSKPQCWDHGCNGREFTTFSNLLRHKREKSGKAAKSYCSVCGAEFTRATAINAHLQDGKCGNRSKLSTTQQSVGAKDSLRRKQEGQAAEMVNARDSGYVDRTWELQSLSGQQEDEITNTSDDPLDQNANKISDEIKELVNRWTVIDI